MCVLEEEEKKKEKIGTFLFNFKEQGRANLTLAVPCGFGPNNHGWLQIRRTEILEEKNEMINDSWMHGYVVVYSVASAYPSPSLISLPLPPTHLISLPVQHWFLSLSYMPLPTHRVFLIFFALLCTSQLGKPCSSFIFAQEKFVGLNSPQISLLYVGSNLQWLDYSHATFIRPLPLNLIIMKNQKSNYYQRSYFSKCALGFFPRTQHVSQ